VVTLKDGYNRITATLVDPNGIESDECTPLELWLYPGTGIVVVYPNAPDGILAETYLDGSTEKIRVTVWVDRSSNYVRLYSDTIVPGTMDYVTALTTETNPKTSDYYPIVIEGITSGTARALVYGARALNAGNSVEQNTDVTDVMLYDLNAPTAVSSLSGARA
jgi:hypothetical protein